MVPAHKKKKRVPWQHVTNGIVQWLLTCDDGEDQRHDERVPEKEEVA